MQLLRVLAVSLTFSSRASARKGHLRLALQLPSPFKPGSHSDADTWFAARTLACFEPFVGNLRRRVVRAIRRASTAWEPLRDALGTRPFFYPDKGRRWVIYLSGYLFQYQHYFLYQ